MPRQPNIDPPVQDLPRSNLIPEAPARWRPDRPGMITAPEQLSSGGLFGRPGPDTGWAFRIIRQADLASAEREAVPLLATLMATRASLLGRAPIPEDLEVARIVMGYEGDTSDRLMERRQRWLKEAAHEVVPGSGAAEEIGAAHLVRSPAAHRAAIADLG